jgi:hypothetical protein
MAPFLIAINNQQPVQHLHAPRRAGLPGQVVVLPARDLVAPVAIVHEHEGDLLAIEFVPAIQSLQPLGLDLGQKWMSVLDARLGQPARASFTWASSSRSSFSRSPR